MHKKFLVLAALLTACIGAKAENLVVNDVVLPLNTSTAIEIELNNPNLSFEGFTFSIELPDGVVPVMGSNGYPDFVKGSRLADTNSPNSGYVEGTNTANFALLTNGSAIRGTSGIIISPLIRLSTELQVGTKLQATVKDIKFTTPVPSTEELDDVTFFITVGEPEDTRVLLDENSTTAPEASNGEVDVKVTRTINANEWSTIVLPFAMTETQVKTAFGNDVELSDFTGYVYDSDHDKITINFSDVTAIEANHPYIIKVSQKVTEFTVDGVNIDPVDEPKVAAIKRTRRQWSEFIGTYVAGFSLAGLLEEEISPLFLSGNSLWYASEDTHSMKAFRAYFDFSDELSEKEKANSRITMSFDNNATGIRTVSSKNKDVYYNLLGQPVNKPSKGAYIHNNKVVILK